MVRRRKSRIERFFSLNQHRKRWGAWRHVAADPDLAAMRERIVEAGEPVQTGRTEKSLDLHLANLRREFSGQPELLLHHATLIVLIRREVRPAESLGQFLALWGEEAEFLCGNLNLRWLISAADTFADHAPDVQARAAAMMASLLGNTVKIYESDRYIRGAGVSAPLPKRVERLQTERVTLFDGMLVFTVGTEDTLRNMYWRLEPYFAAGHAGKILKTVYDRMQVNDTAFARLRALHRRDRTGWWEDEA
ncbi:hypothetical protein [Paracoccus denitrificans]|jgi:hypothetical protein|nr:hypothetical protein [Paracoccus denitrificans]MBB4627642.1 hypothetical protein [Paracoccus denitrificans]MCU7429006.1 hypothetical protein [Paracoccus denitrificans]UPV95078.1 hypothetical protein M0K93_00310 [Paracoccus denitrificans]WQO32866.1 hypothetical protein U0005_11125 [Paracoccus denitrificans]SDI50678.1 hypothetical protein SAMN04244581_01700 [Paracoccus denitrificans]